MSDAIRAAMEALVLDNAGHLGREADEAECSRACVFEPRHDFADQDFAADGYEPDEDDIECVTHRRDLDGDICTAHPEIDEHWDGSLCLRCIGLRGLAEYKEARRA